MAILCHLRAVPGGKAAPEAGQWVHVARVTGKTGDAGPAIWYDAMNLSIENPYQVLGQVRSQRSLPGIVEAVSP